MHRKKIIVLFFLFSLNRSYSLDIKDIYFIPEFSYIHYYGVKFYGGGLSIDKDFSFSKHFSLTTGLSYSIAKIHQNFTVDPSPQPPSTSSLNIGLYYQTSTLSELFIPIGIKYFITSSKDKKLSLSIGVIPLFNLIDKTEGAYYRTPFYSQPFDPGPYPYSDNRIKTGRRSVFSVTNSISLDYCYPLSPKFAINFRGTVMKGFYDEPFITTLGIGIKFI